jgi:hypothetical protein
MISKFEIGEKRLNKIGLEYELCSFEGGCKKGTRYKVKFTDTGYTRVVAYTDFAYGSIKDLLNPAICSVGYIGVGKYTSNGDDVVCYQTWNDMLKRCYAPKSKSDARIYYNVTVHPSWHNYQVFAKWFYINYTKGYRLDKDLMVIGNNEYSPDTCCFVPNDVNSFITGKRRRGVYYCNKYKKWASEWGIGTLPPNGKMRTSRIEYYNCETEAVFAYKKVKQNLCDNLEIKYPELPSIIFENIRTIITNIQ